MNRSTIFHSDDDRLDFGRLLDEGHGRFGADVIAYCLMGNHFHLLLRCSDGGLSAYMHLVAGQFARHGNERLGRDGPVFRSRFFSRSVTTDQYLLNAVRYIHRNPRDLRPAVDLADYRWSSHRTYVGLRPRPRWLRPDIVLERFTTSTAFDRFVRANRDHRKVRVAEPQDLWNALGTVIEAEEKLDRSPQGLARTLALIAVDSLEDVTGRRMLEMLGYASRDAEQQALRRARRAEAAEPRLRELVERALELVQVVPGTT